MGKSKAAPERLTAAERKQRAVELRKLGFSYQKIADQMGISVSGAHKMVTSALKEINEKTSEGAKELRRLELERLDEWMLRVAQEIKSGRPLGAIDRGIRIMNRRAKLLGLDAPTKMELKEADYLLVDDILEAMASQDPRGEEAFRRLSQEKESVIAVWLKFMKEAPLIPVCSSEDVARMTPEQLARAAQGKLTPEELAEIRARPENEAEA